MVIGGRVQNGVVVLEGGASLPEGMVVSVVVPAMEGAAPILAQATGAREWASFFATKLVVGSAAASEERERLELSGDDLLF